MCYMQYWLHSPCLFPICFLKSEFILCSLNSQLISSIIVKCDYACIICGINTNPLKRPNYIPLLCLLSGNSLVLHIYACLSIEDIKIKI